MSLNGREKWRKLEVREEAEIRIKLESLRKMKHRELRRGLANCIKIDRKLT